MATSIQAVFENGVFRPLQPVGIPENSYVCLFLPEEMNAESKQSTSVDGTGLAEQNWQARFHSMLDYFRTQSVNYPKDFIADASRDAMYPDE